MKRFRKFSDYILIVVLAAGMACSAAGCGSAGGYLSEDAAAMEFADEGFADEEFADEGFADENFAGEEFSDGEPPEEELSGDEHPDEEFADEELSDEEFADEELADEEFAGEEFSNREPPEEELSGDEHLDEGSADEELLDGEFSNQEPADDGLLDGRDSEVYSGSDASESEGPLYEDMADDASEETKNEEDGSERIDLSDIPEYDGSPYVVINDNVPFFDESEMTTEAFEEYSELDSLGRCGVAYANICTELMPTEDRESISSVTPTGWHSVTYDIVDGNYLYNRCHLIGFQLAGENANEQNLITGTRYLNVDGMLPFENMVADYVEETDNHVLYRVTPYFDGDDLVASGVLIEAMSVEDEGEGIMFCVYCYNVQPGVVIDYSTGDSALAGDGESLESGGEG